MIEVSIVIVNFKVKKEIISCIESIEQNTKKISYEIIVVDNEGDNSLKNELKKYKQVKYILSKKNLGFGAGNNLGASIAKGEYLFFLNPDTLVLDNAVENFYKFIKSNKNIGIVSPLLVNNKLTPFKTQSRKELNPFNAIYSFSFLRKFFPKKSIYNDDFFKYWDKKLPIEVDTVPGAALMISKKLFDKVNGFDEHFFLYFEENDLSNRVRKLGYELFIIPQSKIIHKVGQSTKNLKNIENIYKKSRFLYLKKHYGFSKALFTEMILRLNRITVFISLIIFLALFLRIYNISNSMTFIGDQGWFYLSARDLLINGNIPLVGITSSHTWLHQGPLWTYMLSIPLFIFRFNPVAGGYLTAILGTITVFLMYKIGSLLFSKRTGVIAAIFYAVSPLIVFFDRTPFDPTPIPLFTVLYLFVLYKWVKGSIYFFPLIIFLIAILYNLELATFTLFFPFAAIFAYGVLKNKEWIKGIFNKKIFIYSLIAFILPMSPILIYDYFNGYRQTIIFLGWTLYKPFSFLFRESSGSFMQNMHIVIVFLLTSIQKLIFQYNLILSTGIFVFSIIFLIFSAFKDKKNKIENPRFILGVLLLISLIGILINQSPSDAYLPIIFPFVIFTVALFLDFLLNIKRIKYVVMLFIFFAVLSNAYFSFKNNFSNELTTKINAVNMIIALTKDREYNLIGEGIGAQFESFTMNYEYLLWWKGYPPSKNQSKLKVFISETKEGIILRKKIND